MDVNKRMAYILADLLAHTSTICPPKMGPMDACRVNGDHRPTYEQCHECFLKWAQRKAGPYGVDCWYRTCERRDEDLMWT